MILTDALVDRLHAFDVETFRVFAEAVVRAQPDAATTPLGTGWGLVAGEGSPLTQVCGFAHRAPGDPEAIEAFFAARVANWEVSVTPFTDPQTVQRLFEMGYAFAGLEGQLAQEIDALPDAGSHEIVEVGPERTEAWIEASDRAWGGDETASWTPGNLIRTIAAVPSRNYLALVDGVPAAAASMTEWGDGVLLRGGATRVPYRGRGLQSALLARRLRDAGRGRLAIIGAAPGSISYRNAQRVGFQPLYSTLTLMRRPTVEIPPSI